VIVGLLVACTASDSDTDAVFDPQSLADDGPYTVGYREDTVTYDHPIAGGERSLRLAVWWPSDDVTGTEVRYDLAFPAPGVFGNAGVAAGGPFPLIVFSHGHQGFAENSAFLMRHLASHGFVVVAPDHTGNTTFDGSDRVTAIYAERPLDISSVLDWVEALPGSDPLAGHTTGPITAIGHSFGGYTMMALAGATYDPAVIAACADDPSGSYCSEMDSYAGTLFAGGFRDDRIIAITAMAPGDFDLFGADGVGAIGIPAFHMTGGLDPNPDNESYWAALQGGPNRRLNLPTAGHQAFTTFSGSVGDPEGAIDPETGWRIVNAYSLAWEWRVRGDERGAAVLDGDVAISDLAAIQR
jgi:predicted dienelactone hydrolase